MDVAGALTGFPDFFLIIVKTVEKQIINYNNKLDMLKEYMDIYIPLKSAVIFKFHKSNYFPSLLLPTTLWVSQIPSFDDYIKDRDNWKSKKSFHMININ